MVKIGRKIRAGRGGLIAGRSGSDLEIGPMRWSALRREHTTHWFRVSKANGLRSGLTDSIKIRLERRMWLLMLSCDYRGALSG